MAEVMPEPRTTISEFAPRFYTLTIPTDKIRELIGPGGKTIRGIIEATGVKIDVEDSGKVNVSSSDQAAAAKALQMIGDITATAEVGKTYLGKVTRLADFGAFVEIIPGTDGLLHISEVAEHRIKDIRDELHEGDQVLVKVLAVEGNRIRLSRKAILKEQRAKMGGAPAVGAPHSSSEESLNETGVPVTFEGGDDFEEEVEGGDEPNFNRDDAPTHAGVGEAGGAPSRGPRGPRPGGGGGGRPGGGGGGRRRGRGGRPGGGGGGGGRR
jgi:polyribonucleotide nucleotidyltransferase